MKKRVIGLLLVLCLILALCVACNTEVVEKDTEVAVDEETEDAEDVFVSLNYSDTTPPENIGAQGMDMFAELAAEYSGGSVEIVVYHSGSLYADGASTLDALYAGDVALAPLSPNSAALLEDYLSMFTMGYLYKDFDHYVAVWESDEVKEKVYGDIEAASGAKILGRYYAGSRCVNTVDGPIVTPDDLDGMLLRMPNTPEWLFLGESLGANPTPLAFSELYTGLQTGIADGQDNPPGTTYDAKFYEVAKHLSLTKHVIDSNTIAINADIFDSLSENQQSAIMRAATEACAWIQEQTLAAEEGYIKALEEEGVTITQPDVDVFSKTVQDAYWANEEMTASWDLELFDLIQSLAK